MTEGAPSDVAPVEPHRPTSGGLAEVAWTFLRLGCLSFGGPIAHLGYRRGEIVEKRKWIDDVHGSRDIVVALLISGLLEHWKAPPWFVVAASAAAGQRLLTG